MVLCPNGKCSTSGDWILGLCILLDTARRICPPSVQVVSIRWYPYTKPIQKGILKTMAWKRKARSSNKSNQSTAIGSYTVTMMQGKTYIECDTCGLPSATLYEFEDGSSSCDVCVNGMSTTDYLLTGILMTGGMYGLGGDW